MARKPKVIEYNGLNVKLYSFSVLMSTLGKSRMTCMKLERLGLLPAPLFVQGEARYYTSLELDVIPYLKITYGIPLDVREGKEYEFFTELRKYWQIIRESLSKGQEPEIPFVLKFSTPTQVYEKLQGMFSEVGIYDKQFVRRCFNKLLEHRLY